MIHFPLFTLLFLFFAFLSLSCTESAIEAIPIPQLAVEDVGVTEVWLSIRLTDGVAKVPLLRNGDTLFHALSAPLDTVIYDSGLLPKHTYTYKAGKGTPLTVTTMDTTSHDFTFTQYQLGDGQNSIVRDVAIVNDSDIYAVGEFYIRDSTGAWDETLYNVGHWDGNDWKLMSVKMRSYGFDCEFVTTIAGTFQAVFALPSGNIIVTNGGNVALINKTGVSDYPCFPINHLEGRLRKLWGTNENNIYSVGTKGTILHFQDGVWSKMESGTDVDLLDVWGTPDGSTVWACGWVDFMPTALIRIQNNICQKVYEDPFPFTLREDSLSGIMTSVWTNTNKKLFVGTHYGLYQCFSGMEGKGKRYSFAPRTFPGFPYRMRGNSIADIVIVGTYNFIGHFNGYSWKHFTELMDDNGRLLSLAQTRYLFVAGGYSYDPINGTGIVILGKR